MAKRESVDGGAYLLFGADEYRVAQRARELVDGWVPEGDRQTALDLVDGSGEKAEDVAAALQRCADALAAPGLFGGHRAVWLRDTPAFGTGQEAGWKEVSAAAQGLVASIEKGLAGDVLLVMSVESVDKRKALYKALSKVAKVEEFAVAAKGKQDAGLPALNEEAARHGLRMDKDVRDAFLGRTGTATRQIVNEVEKLAVYLGDRRRVTVADVMAVVSPTRERAGWDLEDAVGKRELGLALGIIRQLLFQGESAVGLVMAMERRMDLLSLYRDGLRAGWIRLVRRGDYVNVSFGDPPPAVAAWLAKDAKRDPRRTHPYRASLLAQQAAGWNGPGQLERALEACVTAHERMVSTALDGRLALEMLVLDILGRGAGPVRRAVA